MTLSSSISYISPAPSVVALGCFDGVHLGHAAVIREAVARADSLGCLCTVWTFAEPPRNFFSPDSVPLVTTLEEKQAHVGALGADTLVCVPFDRDIAALTAREFFETILLGRLKACHLVCGYNYTFGARGAGDTALLSALCAEHGITLSVLEPVTVGSLPVSSSEIRRAVSEGRIEDARAMLGRPYSITEPVVNGQHLARTLGFPTVNQLLPRKRLIPRAGVYLSRVTRPDGTAHYAISNVGTRPTVADPTLCCESHLFDFSGDLYGQTLTVEFLHFLRPERKFDSIGALAEQVRADIEHAKQLQPKED